MSDYMNFTTDEMFEAVRTGEVTHYDFEEWMDQKLQDRYSDGHEAGYWSGSAAY